MDQRRPGDLTVMRGEIEAFNSRRRGETLVRALVEHLAAFGGIPLVTRV